MPDMSGPESVVLLLVGSSTLKSSPLVDCVGRVPSDLSMVLDSLPRDEVHLAHKSASFLADRQQREHPCGLARGAMQWSVPATVKGSGEPEVGSSALPLTTSERTLSDESVAASNRRCTTGFGACRLNPPLCTGYGRVIWGSSGLELS